MSFDKADDSRSRDTAFARLLAEALEAQAKSTGSAESFTCPDAEVLAAYAEHALAEEEMARWEGHFADCDRCQKIIAILAASGEDLTTAEVERLGSLAASSVAGESAAQKTVPSWIAIWRRPVLWRWLVPAVGLASAVLWIALRQAPRQQVLTAQKTAATTGSPQSENQLRLRAMSPEKRDETQIAQTNLPPPPEATPSRGELRDKEKAQANSSAVARQEQAKKQETSSNALKAPQAAAQAPTVSEADRKIEARDEAAKDNRTPSAQNDNRKDQTYDALTAQAPAAVPAVPVGPPPAPNADRAATRNLDRATRAPAPAELKALVQPAGPAIVFSSPDRRALWRIRSGGRIERSADQGQTWQPQTSGVTADLLAGAAPSEKVAWAVGRAGAILRTEDGEHWQRVAPPSTPVGAVLAPDWIGVEARDGLHATITSRDLRRFVTEDGAHSWAQLQ